MVMRQLLTRLRADLEAMMDMNEARCEEGGREEMLLLVLVAVGKQKWPQHERSTRLPYPADHAQLIKHQ